MSVAATMVVRVALRAIGGNLITIAAAMSELRGLACSQTTDWLH